MRTSRIPPVPVLIERYPEVRAWLEGGVPLPQALALGKAGLFGPADLESFTRERFLKLPRLGPKTLTHCERILGRALPIEHEDLDVQPDRDARAVLRAKQWRLLGFGSVAAKALAAQGLSLDRLRQMSHTQLAAISGIGPGSLEVCRKLFGAKQEMEALIEARTPPAASEPD